MAKVLNLDSDVEESADIKLNNIAGVVENENIWVCAICLSTTNVTPLNQAVRGWLSSRGLVLERAGWEWGACGWCGAGVGRAARLEARARTAQERLKEFYDSGQISLKWLTKVNKDNPQHHSLKARHLGANHYDYEIEHNGRTTVLLKKEPEPPDVPEVKQEVFPVEWSESDYEVLAENIDGHSDNSEKMDLDDLKKEDLNHLKKDLDDSELTTKVQKKRKLSKAEKKQGTKKKKRKNSDEKLVKSKKKDLSDSKKDLDDSKQEKNGEALSAIKKSQIETDLKLKEFFDIQKLTTEQQKEEILQRKQSVNYIKSEMKCELCFKWFFNTKSFESHMVGHSDKLGRHRCPVCHVSCVSQSAVGRHVNNQHRYRFTCRICAATFKYRTAARMHINWHQGKKYVCDVCGQEFDHQNSCLGHKRIKHPSEEHVCALCGFSFLNEKGLRYHRSRRHALENDAIPEDGPLCAPCNIRFKNADALAAHLRASPKHGDSARNEPNRLQEPVKKKREPIACEQCGKQMSSVLGYSAHFAKYHPTSTRTVFPRDATPSLCTVCGKTFKNVKNMQFHARVHSSRWRYECSVCHKIFRRKDFLQKHVNIHTNERKYPCHVCGKAFNHAGNRDRHLRVHSSKDCKCDLCDKCFKSEKEVEIHVKYVHLKMPYPKRNRQRSTAVPVARTQGEMFLNE